MALQHLGFRERLRIGTHRIQLLAGAGAVVAIEGPDSPAGYRVVVPVADVDAHHARSLAAGAPVSRWADDTAIPLNLPPMSVLSASGHLSPAQAEEYSAALLGLLGSTSPLTVLRDTPRLLRQELDLIPLDRISVPEAAGKWSARMVVAHLADSELVGAFRLRMILAHDRPALTPYDQDVWAKRLRYERADPEASLERFTVLRRANLTFWAEASPAELARVGLHGQRGEESVDRMRRLYAGHDLAHLRQLSRIRILLTGQ